VFFIASNSGVNKSIIGMALAVKARGHKLIAVTSLDHLRQVPPHHVSGKRLYEIADVVIDNLAPRGDTVLTLESGAGVGAVSPTTLMRPLRRTLAEGHTCCLKLNVEACHLFSTSGLTIRSGSMM